MCGRARCTLRPDDVPRACNRHGFPARFLHLECFRPSYNVAPGSYLPVLRKDNDGVAVHCMKWGLVPGFTRKTDKPDFFKMFNARSESVAEKASFRRLLPKNRGLVAVDGFYEWKKEGSKKQPYYIHFEDGRPLVFAALFDSWQNSGGETLYTFTILTTASSSALDWLHDRMPVILSDKDSVDTWLDDPSTSKLKPLLAPYENSDLVWYPVTSAIGKLSFDGPECTQQIPLKASQNSLISKFFSAKQPKTEESDKETRLTDVKEEPMIEGYEGVVVSDNDEEVKELDEGKDSSNEAEEKIVKAEPFTEDNSAVASHLEAVKNKVEGSINGEGESIETGRTNETGESKIVKAEPFIEDNSVVASHLEAVKNEVEEGINGEGESIETVRTNETGESKIVKAEPFIEDNSAVASHLESVKNAVEEGINGEGESIETGFTNETDESYNIDIPRISKEEHETQGHSIPANKDLNQLKIQHQVVQDKPRNENYCEGMKEGALEFSGKSSGKSGTKRDYELLSEQEKPSKHNVRLQEVSKSCGKQGRKQGKGKSNIKKSKETQSTLHFFFDEK